MNATVSAFSHVYVSSVSRALLLPRLARRMLEQFPRQRKLPGTKLSWERKGIAIFHDSRIAENALVILLAWQERADARGRLAAMDDSRLNDLGLTATEARREAGKPFWRA